jgi:polar amino acid transport system substrate-binding protein
VLRTVICIVLLGIVSVAHADEPRKLVVGTKQTPPFAFKTETGEWSGISIDLWRRVAGDLNLAYEIREYDLKGLLAAVQAHEVDVAVASLTITAERERLMDFAHPMFSSGLAIATRPGGKGGALAALRGLLTWDLAKLLACLFGLLTAIGTLVWFFERRHNEAQFARDPVKGIAAGVWWSAVTMTTVGYGDKSPITIGGRILGLAWMFVAIILLSFFTASITSTLTVDRLESAIKGPDDLPRVRVVSIAGSTSAAYLDRRHITYATAPTIVDGLRLVAADQADAMVYDAPPLKYLAKHELGGAVIVLPQVFERQDYGFALPDGSPLREDLNRALLTELGSSAWQDLVEHYLGSQ